MLRRLKSFFIIGLLLVSCGGVYGQGLKGEYFPNMTLAGQPTLTRIEAVNFNWGGNSPGDPIGANNFSVRWTGSITVPTSGDYVFGTRTDDGVRLWVGAQQAINNWSDHSATMNRSAPIPLRAGEPVGIKLEFYENGGDAVMELYWSGPGIAEEMIPAVVLSPTYVVSLKAYNPKPADGTVGVEAPLLEWTAGPSAMFHDVYLATSPDLTEADRQAKWHPLPLTLYYHVPGLTPGGTYYWRIDEIEKDGVTTHTGDVWSFVAQDVTAYYPDPADAGAFASTTPTLTWKRGTGATQHRLYFGEDADAVAQGAAETDQGTFALGEAVFVPGLLDALTTYYWRVDEILSGGAVTPGTVWSFTTALPIDDFESYNDDGNRIYDVWIDGLTDQAKGGSQVGYDVSPFAEQTFVYDANQSMPLDFNNVDEPFYSETEREFAGVQDWTAGDATTLVLYVRGLYTNTPEQLYVAVEDASGNAGVVVYPDPSIVTGSQWIEWKIPFTAFTDAGVNLARVKKLAIGLGDRTDPKPGGAGLVFIDAIRIAK